MGLNRKKGVSRRHIGIFIQSEVPDRTQLEKKSVGLDITTVYNQDISYIIAYESYSLGLLWNITL